MQITSTHIESPLLRLSQLLAMTLGLEGHGGYVMYGLRREDFVKSQRLSQI
jgi:hypothetical protein